MTSAIGYGPDRVLPSRRRFLAGAAGLAVAAFSPRRTFATTAPHTFKHGDFEIIVVSDGAVTPPGLMLASDAPPEELAAAFREMTFVPGESQLPCNVTLLRTAKDLILVDTGSGAGLGPTAGKLSENLSAAGIDPAAVTKVVLSHAHADHVWGTIGEGGALSFPNAAYYVAATEWDFWMAPETVAMFPPEFQGFVTEAVRHLAGVEDRVTMVKPGDDIVTGVRVLDSAGHTPGHISLEVAGDEGLIIVVDAVVFPRISFEHPDWRFAMDSIQELAGANRRKLLERAATDRLKLIGYHWPYPGIGYAERRNGSYRLVPLT